MISNQRLTEVEKVARILMNQHGLNDWLFKFDGAVRRQGVCYYPWKDEPGRIQLSKHYAGNPKNSEADIIDTILHEIAHALVGYQPGDGHGEAWQAMCIKVGARPIRCQDKMREEPAPKYKATCGGCYKEFGMYRNRLKAGEYYSCVRCGPERGRLNYVAIK